jgi:hypothetical protein
MLICLYYEDLQVARYEVDAVPPAGGRNHIPNENSARSFFGWVPCSRKVSSDTPLDYNFETLAPQLVVNVSVYDLKACLE